MGNYYYTSKSALRPADLMLDKLAWGGGGLVLEFTHVALYLNFII